ncbi:MAG: DUF4406 domain-containing protein [Deltaproteobacteria bacterium]|nr:DUF4406 domain-containing protein [Deltaproteobacteria bacterium]
MTTCRVWPTRKLFAVAGLLSLLLWSASANAIDIGKVYGLDRAWQRLARLMIASIDAAPAGKPVYYLSGPISTGGKGSIEANLDYGIAVARRLRAAGYHVLSPFDVESGRLDGRGPDEKITQMVKGWSHATFMRVYQKVFTHPRLAGAIFLPGWESSTGAVQERAWFQSKNRPVFAFAESSQTKRGFLVRKEAYHPVLALLEDALLKPGVKPTLIRQRARRAKRLGLRAVIVRPNDFELLAGQLSESRTIAGAVIGFPRQMFSSIASFERVSTSTKLEQTRTVIDAARRQGLSAIDLDMVLDVVELKRGSRADQAGKSRSAQRRYDRVQADIDAVCAEAKAYGRKNGVSVKVKVIVETSLLTRRQLEIATAIVRSSAALAIKTSTGFGPRGTRVGDVRTIKRLIGDTKLIKASGGIGPHNFAPIKAAGAHLFGTSRPRALLSGKRAPRASKAY